jgi:aspartyl-tRNA(Asn)/glutamyl-tRNA(Gln) amidotransferase subunit A
MNNPDIAQLTLIETIKALEEKQFSTEELNKAYFERINKYDKELNSFITLNSESAGIPAAVKDVISTKGIQTTAGSKILEGYIPPYNATAVERLLANNISIIGKTNCDEFAQGSSGENSGYGLTRNPWDKSKVPGGSSSGSAIAVASDFCSFALGTDTGGSIRQPASLSGIVGLKPSYGRVSRYGAIAMASSLDQIGPFTKTVADSRLVLSWISGADGYDSNAVEKFAPEGSSLIRNSKSETLKGMRVGIPKEYFGQGLDEGVKTTVQTAIKKLEELGATTVEVELPNTQYAVAVYYILMASEVSSNMGRLTGIRYGHDRSKFGAEVKRRIMLGTFSLSTGYYDAYYEKAAKVRTLIKQDFEKAFDACDVIVGPVSPTVAWNIGEKISDPLAMYLSDVYTIPANLAGICGLSVPCGFSNGLPVGLQILGPQMGEEAILNVGEVYENATEWRKEKPKL